MDPCLEIYQWVSLRRIRARNWAQNLKILHTLHQEKLAEENTPKESQVQAELVDPELELNKVRSPPIHCRLGKAEQGKSIHLFERKKV